MNCITCGEEIFNNAKFCTNCGVPVKKMKSTAMMKNTDPVQRESVPSYKPKYSTDYSTNKSRSSTIPRKNTGLLNFVIFMGIIVAISLFVALLYAISFSPPMGIIFVTLLYFEIWIILGLNNHDNTTRLVLIFLTVLSLLFEIMYMRIFPMLISLIILYTLLFHKRTVHLFETKDMKTYTDSTGVRNQRRFN